jgi:hypothetical protein
MRLRKPVTIPYVAKIAGVNGLQESELPAWLATTQVTGVQVVRTCEKIQIPAPHKLFRAI